MRTSHSTFVWDNPPPCSPVSILGQSLPVMSPRWAHHAPKNSCKPMVTRSLLIQNKTKQKSKNELEVETEGQCGQEWKGDGRGWIGWGWGWGLRNKNALHTCMRLSKNKPNTHIKFKKNGKTFQDFIKILKWQENVKLKTAETWTTFLILENKIFWFFCACFSFIFSDS